MERMTGTGGPWSLEAVVIKDITPLIVSRSPFFDNNCGATTLRTNPPTCVD